MKITIVQAEIEAAIVSHIRSLVSVREGMDITVQLAATRGSEGFTAAIDILPTADYVAPLKVAELPIQVMRSGWAPVVVVADPVPVVIPVTEVVKLEPKLEPVVPATVAVVRVAAPRPTFLSTKTAPAVEVPVQDEAIHTGISPDEEAPSAETPVVEVTPSTKSHSLFKTMKRPVN